MGGTGIYVEHHTGVAYVLCGIGLVLAGAEFCSARLGLAAHHKKFRPGLGNACAHCHYNLSGTAEGQVCPECGGSIRYLQRTNPTT